MDITNMLSENLSADIENTSTTTHIKPREYDDSAAAADDT